MKVILFGLACLWFVTTSSLAFERKQPPANVLLQAIAFAPITVAIETVGTAEAQKSVSLFPAAADKVTQVYFLPGDFVEKDKVLIELDARRQISALQRVKIALADRKRDLNRLIKSVANGAVTQSEIDDAQSLLDLAKVSVVEAQADLDDRKVIAPFSGYVGLTDIEPGDRVSQSTLITTIDDRAKLFINFSAPESALGLIDEKIKVTVQPWNNRSDLLMAKLSQLDSRIDVANRTLKVRAVLDNKTDKFRPGLSFKVTMSAEGVQYPKVPEASLAWGATNSHVWLAVNGKAVKKPVQIKQRLRGFILVEGDLNEGDKLIVEGIQRLREGSPVADAALLTVKD